VDGILQAQATRDAEYFRRVCRGTYDGAQIARLEAGTLRAYRWQYIISGAQHPRFIQILGELITAEQGQRIAQALAPIVG
jgi:hypothetical protein